MSAISILEKQSTRLQHYPRMEAKVKEHLEVTRWQAEQVESCLKRMTPILQPPRI